MQTDYLIIGQGLAGSTLAWELMQRGCSVMVIDEPTKNKASSIAAGLFNPVTNKVMARTWMAEIFFPFLQEFYSEAEKKLQRKFFYLLPIYRPFISGEERQQWKAKSEDEALRPFVKHFHSSPAFSQQIHNPFGGIEIAYSGYVEVSAWMAAMRDFLQSKEAFRESSFSETDLILREDAIEYQDVRA
ncbi:MAG: FAD-dependent oxidoreductase, partial [Cyclobacteriaceae bacterium]|nr:FAD-dependent oxidoreductase [Cyclobacteriaceae bacterium]